LVNNKAFKMMNMFFNTDVVLTNILIDGWNADSWRDILIASLIICTLTFIFEALKTLKSYVIYRRKINSLIKTEEDDGNGQENEVTNSESDLLSSLRIPMSVKHAQRKQILLFGIESLVHMFTFLYGYILMLLVMSYNAWFMLAVVLGSGLGFFVSRPFELYFTVSPTKQTETKESCCGGVATHSFASSNLNAGINHS
jgi:hypothetical protein